MHNQDLLAQASHFEFGKNWLDYAEKIDDARIAQAVTDLKRPADRERLDGLSFLDIGCGSGLHALAASRLGAARVMGVDIDPDSVEASRRTLARFAPEADVRFQKCSVFDMDIGHFGQFDIVYSWGVLHHTGDMYRAIERAVALVAPDGLFLVALYRKTPFCGMWRHIKRWYSRATPAGQARVRKIYIALRRAAWILTGQDASKKIVEYGKNRGMDFYKDVHDWLGGYPYQSISPQRCHKLMRGHGFLLEREFVARSGRNMFGLLGSACEVYVFRHARWSEAS